MYANRLLRTLLGALLCLGIAASVASAALLSEKNQLVVGRATKAQRRLSRLGDNAILPGRRPGPHVLAEIQPVKLVNLTPISPANDRLPCWSQNGRRVVFVSDRSGIDRIWSMNIDGTEPRQLTFGPGRDSYPVMSPGGQFLAYASDRFGSWDLFIRDLSRPTAPDQRLTFWNDSDEIEPSWSPVGNELAFSTDRLDDQGDFHIWLIGTHTGNARRLTDTVFEERHAAWSPTFPRLIAYTGTEPHGDQAIWLSVVDSPMTYQLVSDPAQDFDPTWDPTGARICFVSDRGTNNDLWLLRVASVTIYNEIVITPEDPLNNPASNAFEFHLPRPANDIDPSWGPATLYFEGVPSLPRIAFTSNQAGNNDIWLLAPDDFTPPNVNYDDDEAPLVRVTPQQSHPGEVIKITAAVSDNESGVDRVYAVIKCADSPMYLALEFDNMLENSGLRGEIRQPVDYLIIDAHTGKPYNQVWAYDASTLIYGPTGAAGG